LKIESRRTGDAESVEAASPGPSLRVLQVLTYYRPHWTGLTAHAARVAEGLARRGHAVTVMCSRHSPDLPSEETLDGVRVVRLNVVGRISRGMLAPGFVPTLLRELPRHDIVQIHTPLPEAPLVASMARAFKRPMVMTHHGDLVMPPDHLSDRAIQLMGHLVLSATGRLASSVTSYSDDYTAHSRLLSGLGARVKSVPPPVQIPLPDPAGVAALKQRSDLQGRLLVGFAGRWVREKGFDILLRAWPAILQHFPDAQLVYSGEPNVAYENFFEQCEELVAGVRNRLSMLGLLLDPQAMANFYAACDVFVLPSRTDMFALVQAEALMCGTPVVATDIPGARVVVRRTGYGRLAAAEDPPALAEAILEVLANRSTYAPDLRRVRALYDARHSLDAYERLLLDLADAAPGWARSPRSATAP
jgi:glycosyltransferase involved in cell wall biosynthesis